jgi:hypothetical protein
MRIIVRRENGIYKIAIIRKNKKRVYAESEINGSQKARLYRLIINEAKRRNIEHAEFKPKSQMMWNALRILLSETGMGRSYVMLLIDLIEKSPSDFNFMEVKKCGRDGE